MNIGIYQEIVQFVDRSPIEVQPQFEISGQLLGYRIRSLVDLELHYVAHQNHHIGVKILKSLLIEKLQKDFSEGKPLPFKYNEN